MLEINRYTKFANSALYYILPSRTLLSHLLLVPYNLTVKEGTYIHMTRMNNLYLSITKHVIFFAFLSSYDYHLRSLIHKGRGEGEIHPKINL